MNVYEILYNYRVIAGLSNEPKNIENELAVIEKMNVNVKSRKIVDSFCGHCIFTLNQLVPCFV